jgi:multisubunit Na+/H+ antiporter MnhF subunit
MPALYLIRTSYYLFSLQSAAPGDNIAVNVVALDEFRHNTTAFLELSAIQVKMDSY